jgi:hypothetical protein
MRTLFLTLAAAALLFCAACGGATQHIATTGAKASAPATTSSVSSSTDTSALQGDLSGVDAELANVDGQLGQTNADLANSDEGDVQR